MADVTLRAYVKEIDNLIERDQLDEAIAHSRHILQTYPKHLETYRLLGKAYLEAKRFGDAADIFQRVLSAVPEDFVSHIGMAIVREDEGNLDAAIWHMERAFEANPANPAIRQELSRLIGRRDGLEPHKIRLTRGALARQYAQGELFPQAIAELRSALQEDPDRPDLEILLARMYWQSEQFDAAKTLCKQIIEKLPFSLDANRIMASVYQVTNNPEKAGEYHRRLAALDPYMAFVDTAASDPDQISASAVQIDHSDWLPGQPLPTADSEEPDWVSSLGVDLSDDEQLPTTESVPSWMSELEGEVSSRSGGAGAISTDLPDEALTEDGDIPEWMREAGWEASTGETTESPISFSDAELEALDSGGPMPIPEEERGDEEEITPADIPDWLQDIAPSEIPAEPEPEPETEAVQQEPDKKEFVPDWLADISSEADEVPPEPVEDTREVETPVAKEPPPEPVEDTQEVETPVAKEPPSQPAVVELGDENQPEVPTWVEDQAPGATSTIISWLGDRPGDDADDELIEEETQAEELQEMSQEPVAAADDDGEIPSWLDGLDIDEPTEASPAAEPEPVAEEDDDEEVPSWLAGVAGAASEADLDFAEPEASPDDFEAEIEEVEEPKPSEPDEAIDEDAWLRELAVSEVEDEIPTDEEIPDWAAEDEAEDIDSAEPAEVPDWLQGIAETEDQEFPEAQAEEPDWLRGLDVEEEAAEEPAPAPRQDVPEWLQGIADPADADTPAAAGAGAPTLDEEAGAPPSWLEDYSEDGEQAEQVEDELDLQSLREFEAEISTEPDQEEEVISRAPEDIGVGEDLDDEEVYQWLESLAEEQPGEAEIETSSSAGDVSRETAAPIIDDAVPPEEPDESLDWLEDLASERGLDVDVSPQEDASQLTAPEAEVEPPLPEPEQFEEPEPFEEEEEAPDWLRDMASSPTDETVVTPRPPELEIETETEQPEVPGWLDEATSIAAGVPAEPGEADVQVAPEQIPAVSPEDAGEPTRTEEAPPTPEPIQDEVEKTPTPTPEAPKPDATRVEAQEVVPEPPAEAPATPPAVVEPQPPEVESEKSPAPEAPVEVAAEKEEVQPEPEEPPAEAKPEKPVKFKEPLTEPTQLLQSARQALGAGDAGRALSDYRKLIDRKQDIETVIKDLQRAAERYPNLPKVWQTLGDAYMEADQLPDAIKAYKRGMEVA